ncbi:hypothetical protein SELMODRAFT_428911 [Selaginella moellendorffii]|uniref:HAT C-terminal dimerisation domain-containing protein n=1 Tax=Selaginella moellendorffii TaxID=88036 RepID=D8T4E5_SELML|nr:hypothetical protein SELMODRAFT_428911 [Selaginella moellendorffii]
MRRVPAGRSKAAAKAIAQSKQSLLSFAPIVERGGFVDEDNLEGTEPKEGCEVGEGDAASVEEKEKKICRGKWQPAWVIKWRWLHFDQKNALIFCSICRANKNCKNPFGTSGFVPLRKYPLLLELQQLNGVYVPSMYKNVMACSRFITFINKVLLDQILEKVKASPFFGIMLDESTDINTSKHLIFYVTYIHDARVLTSYLGLSMVNNSFAEVIFNTTIASLQDWGLDMSRKQDRGCSKVVNKVASFLSRSSSRLQQLQALQDELDFKVLKVLQIQQTRWLSRGGAITRMCECLEPLLKFFKDGRTTQTRKLYDRLRSFKFLYALHFLGDILAVVDLNGFQLDSRGYPIIPDGGGRNGPLDELRSSIKGNEYRDVEMIRSIHGEDLEEDSEATGILSKFHFLAPINLPSSVHELKAFGMINEAELAEEYSLWKIIASEEWKGKTFVDVWGMIYAHSIWTKKYPNLLKLAMVGMVQCCNIASCECGFSRINLVKNKFRNQMGTEMVDELVRISIEGPPIAKFDFETVEFIRMRFPLLRIMPYTKNTLLHTGVGGSHFIEVGESANVPKSSIILKESLDHQPMENGSYNTPKLLELKQELEELMQHDSSWQNEIEALQVVSVLLLSTSNDIPTSVACGKIKIIVEF